MKFSPTAWAKLLFLRDLEETEVGGFGIAASKDPLLVEDVRLVKQHCSWAHVAFDDESVADFFDEQVDAGLKPEQFGRIWIHTHPGECPEPSGTDEQTFDRVFGRVDWAVMFILARDGATFGRLRFNVGPKFDVELKTEIDFSRAFDGCDTDGWAREYFENVQEELLLVHPTVRRQAGAQSRQEVPRTPKEWYEPWFEYLDDDLATERRSDADK